MQINGHVIDAEKIDMSSFPNLSFMKKEDALRTAAAICEREGRPVNEDMIEGYLNNLDMDMSYN